MALESLIADPIVMNQHDAEFLLKTMHQRNLEGVSVNTLQAYSMSNEGGVFTEKGTPFALMTATDKNQDLKRPAIKIQISSAGRLEKLSSTREFKVTPFYNPEKVINNVSITDEIQLKNGQVVASLGKIKADKAFSVPKEIVPYKEKSNIVKFFSRIKQLATKLLTFNKPNTAPATPLPQNSPKLLALPETAALPETPVKPNKRKVAISGSTSVPHVHQKKRLGRG